MHIVWPGVEVCLHYTGLYIYTLAMRTALGVSPFAMRLLPISCAENCFLRRQLSRSVLAAQSPGGLTSGTLSQT